MTRSPYDTDHDFATALWRALAHCPPDALGWAALAYRIGLMDGRQRVLDDLAEAGRDAARAMPGIAARPRFVELQHRRGECRPGCTHCRDLDPRRGQPATASRTRTGDDRP